jgi:RNA polymerase sigma factor (TIGR02999 family)
MSEVSVLLKAIDSDDPEASAQLLPFVYDELRRLAAQRLAHEPAGQTLQPTALVHEVYLRLVGDKEGTHWQGRGHFFAAAAEAMRRILVENARRKRSLKRGGRRRRRPLEEAELLAPEPREDVLALDEALTQLAEVDSAAAQLVHLRYFGGLTIAEAAEILHISPRAANRLWTYARVALSKDQRHQVGQVTFHEISGAIRASISHCS